LSRLQSRWEGARSTILRDRPRSPAFALRDSRCALVGSGAVLSGRELGAEIDGSHDYVVHINNIPRASQAADMGHRTDIFFTTLCTVSRPDWDNVEVEKRPVNDEDDDMDETCVLDDGRHRCNQGGHPFRAVVFRAPQDNGWCPDDAEDMVQDAARETSLPLGMSKDFISQAAHYLRRDDDDAPHADLYRGKPTTGLHAMLTMALACQSLTLYGFSGSATADGHRMSEDHGIEREHALLHALVDHSLPTSAFPPHSPIAGHWWRTNVTFR